MKSILLVAFSFLLSLTPVVAASTVSGDAEITGYGDNEFAVKETIEQQISENVVVRLSKQLSAIGGRSHIVISIIGSADRTGPASFNDDLGKKRAEEVKAFLSLKFPDAKIVTRTKGYELNTKTVFVHWEISALALPPAAPKRETHWAAIMPWAVPFLGTIALIAALLAYLFSRNRAQEEAFAPEPAPTVEWAEATWEKDGKVYRTPMTQKDGVWRLPFLTEKEPVGILSRKDKGQARGAVKSSMKNPNRRTEIEGLISSGVIKKEEKYA